MNRREFLKKNLGVIVSIPLISGCSKKRERKLIATTDYNDNVGYYGSNCFFEKKHLDDLHKYLSSIGVSRHQWIYNPLESIYDSYPMGFDLLKEAADSAHAHGLEFYAQIKVFEGGASGNIYPHTLPFPEGVCALKDIRGIFPRTTPFVSANPHMCLKRRPGTYEFNGRISAIRLVKEDNKPTRVRREHLTIWTSPQNNRFEQYNGPVSFRESYEWRPTYPKSQQCRILNLEGLRIPVDHKYILVRCSLADKRGDFTNERGNIVELEDIKGNKIPLILGSGPIEFNPHRDKYENWSLREAHWRYFQLPEVQSEFKDINKAQKHYRDFYNFYDQNNITKPYTLDSEGYVAVACGKPEYMLGNLHPIYPEVRKHWLDLISFCLDRGVDGINIRTSNHVRSNEAWEYGFNEPVIEAAGGKTDYPTIRRINGDAYTQFLREARNLIKSRGKSFTIHLYSQMLMPDDRIGNLYFIPPNFEWQWKTWVREIADELEFRGAWTLRPFNLRQVLETFSAVTSAANKPFYFQSNFKELWFDGPNHFTRNEIEMINNYQGIDGYVLYETANFTRMNKEKGEIEGSGDVAKLISNHFFLKGTK